MLYVVVCLLAVSFCAGKTSFVPCKKATNIPINKTTNQSFSEIRILLFRNPQSHYLGEESIVDEHGTLNLDCGDEHVIGIASASYGKLLYYHIF